jgi:hypothetical protein
MLITLAMLFLVAWLLGFAVFHVGSVAIHVLLIVAIVSIVVHFARTGRPAP